jgi:hypothetical protein
MPYNIGNRYQNPVQCDYCPEPAILRRGVRRVEYLCEECATHPHKQGECVLVITALAVEG